MYRNLKSKEEGFTIIEVVLVLAIAALIFLIVFLALPALQRSRRDTQRKSDAGRALSALESYASNNNGQYPTTGNWGAFVSAYLTNGGATFGDPSTGSYTLVAGPPAEGQIRYQTGATCTGTGSARDVAVTVHQESGGTYCQDNS